MTWRCSAAALERDDELAGTASTVRSFLLVENPGPWGVEALRDSRLPAGVASALRRTAASAQVRVLLIRRHQRSARRATRDGLRVFAARAAVTGSWLEATRVERPEDLLDLDLAGLGAGRSPGLEPHADPVFLTCTHGRHDTCCAERGRPVAAALAAAYPEHSWECSHIGGDRFAANLLVLPHGLYLGRVDAESAVEVARAHLGGRLDLDHLRGRSCLSMPAQAAEIALRRELGETRLDVVVATGVERAGAVTLARFHAGGATYEVTVHTAQGPAAPLTCRAAIGSPVPRHEVVSIATYR